MMMTEVYLLILLKFFNEVTVQLVLGSLSCTSKVQSHYNHFHIINFYIKFKYCFPVITHRVALVQYEKRYTNSFSRSHAQSMRTEVCIPTIKLIPMLVFSYQLYSQSASTLPFSLASNLCYDQLVVPKIFISASTSTSIKPGQIHTPTLTYRACARFIGGAAFSYSVDIFHNHTLGHIYKLYNCILIRNGLQHRWQRAPYTPLLSSQVYNRNQTLTRVALINTPSRIIGPDSQGYLGT